MYACAETFNRSVFVESIYVYICIARHKGSNDNKVTNKQTKTFHCILEKESPRIFHSNGRVLGKASNPVVNVTIGDKVFVEADSVIEIACPTTGKPKPKITWQRRGLNDFFSCFIYPGK